jgi:hypothetical protein
MTDEVRITQIADQKIIGLRFAKQGISNRSREPKTLALQSIDEVVTDKSTRSTNQGQTFLAHSHGDLHASAPIKLRLYQARYRTSGETALHPVSKCHLHAKLAGRRDRPAVDRDRHRGIHQLEQNTDTARVVEPFNRPDKLCKWPGRSLTRCQARSTSNRTS